MKIPRQKSSHFTILTFHGSIILILAVFLHTPIAAFELALGPRAGSAGAGLECHTRLHSKLNARMGMNLFSLKIDGSEAEFDYSSRLNLKTLSLLLDWMPGSTNWRLSCGVFVNYNSFDFRVNPNQDYHIGAIHYKSSELGYMKGTVDFDRFAPYLGVGWGVPLRGVRKFNFVMDLGFFYQNSPRVDYTATGWIAPSADQKGIIEKDLQGWKIYGVLSIGMMVKL